MERSKEKNLLIICGPTAIGKTSLGVEVAKWLHTEIISADSRQLYQEMSIGTAKPSLAEMQNVKHYFVDSHSVEILYSVGDFERDALEVLDKLFQIHDTVVVVGGTGLYIKALCEGLDEFPEVPLSLREELNEIWHTQGIEPLQEKLKILDPVYAAQMDIQNPQRVVRALEICIGTGQPFSSFLSSSKKKRNFNVIKIGLNTERAKLFDNINKRVDIMFENGLLEEVQKLFPLRHLNALQTVGYKELFDYLEGQLTLEEAKELIKRNTRHYAKRQLTWFKKDQEIKWFEPKFDDELKIYLKIHLSL